MITLLDYGAGNVRSVVNAIESLGHRVKPVTSPADIIDAQKLVFPGVGAFGQMIKILHEKKFFEPLKTYLESGRPFFGICLGLQALFETSEEAPDVKGLGIFPGTVKRFDVDLAVPHIGWNGICVKQASPIFSGLAGNEKFYFVHAYHVAPEEAGIAMTTTDYGYSFVSSVQRGNIVGTQFHPEKSGNPGLQILKNFIESDTPAVKPARILERTQLAKRIIACLDVRSNDQGDLVVTKGDQYDVREDGAVRNLGMPVDLARRYYEEGADEITFLNITGFRDFPLKDMPMLDVLQRTSRKVFVPLTIGGGIRDFTDKDGRRYTALDSALVPAIPVAVGARSFRCDHGMPSCLGRGVIYT
ncbi:MAG: imidazole glycerol phosphate synthase subunit HisH, partial [Deltaproteobacteria bacterium]|nr:imidazole glycerol phosphate synthase subunit HisH [Deltaproteobacteria bacterium]